VIKYLKSKRKLLDSIIESFSPYHGATVLDLFSGTARVGHAAKSHGYRVISSDLNHYAHTLATCYVQADHCDYAHKAQKIIEELNALPGQAGYFTETYCEKSRYFHPKNGARIDAIRDFIAQKIEEPILRAILLTSLMEAADRVDSTCGVQMAYLKDWAARAHNELHLRLPELLDRQTKESSQAVHADALDFIQEAHADITYLDPPYNQHSYLGNYHIWETLVLNDKPEVYGIAHKRIDCKERKSAFNSKRAFKNAFAHIIEHAPGYRIVVSFNNEGYLSPDELIEILQSRGEVTTIDHHYRRYIGASIGVFNPQGERVGEAGHSHNLEHLFIVNVKNPQRCVEYAA
jgi:adenine-specific DNA-methyltransferase